MICVCVCDMCVGEIYTLRARPATHARSAPNSIHTRYVLHTHISHSHTIPGSGLESAALDILDTCVVNLGGSF